MSWLIFFLTLLKASLFSTGGFGPLPSLHKDFLAYKWAGETQFTESMAIGQVTPGPSGLWVISLCYLTDGLAGALLACIALLLPPLLILIVQRFYLRVAHLPATQGLLDGVVLVIASFSIIVLFGMFLSNGIDTEVIVISVVSAVLAISRRVSVNIILIAAILIGAIFH